MEYYEKREYSDGTKYVQVSSLNPGVTYYIKCVDENHQIYFSPTQSTLTVPTLQMTSPGFMNSSPQYAVSGNQPNGQASSFIPTLSLSTPSLYSAKDIYTAQALHLGITITSLFVPTIIYLIGWPFVWAKYRQLFERNPNNPNIQQGYKNYSGVGWTAWILHLASLITFCTFWIPSCREYNYFNYYYSAVSISRSCLPTAGGLIAVIVIPIITFIFTLVVTILGSLFLNNLHVGQQEEMTFISA